MKTISLTEIEPTMESVAVAAGKAVLAAMPDDGQLMIEDNDLVEDAWAEMVAYLGRRGVSIRYELAFPVAELT